MFRVKICGITNQSDAADAARAGADAIGLNFYPHSRRCVPLDEAERIASSLPDSVLKVGVFVNAPAADIRRLDDALRLDFIQLHGDEPPDFLHQFDPVRLIRALRIGPDGLTPVWDYLRRCVSLGCRPAAVLLDAHRAGQYGGTGKTADWAVAAEYPGHGGPPLVLAGGLTPDNVAAAIRVVGPSAVDTASGVEISPGQKDPAAVAAFVAAARDALADISRS